MPKVRSELWVEGDNASGYKRKVRDFFDNGVVHTECKLNKNSKKNYFIL